MDTAKEIRKHHEELIRPVFLDHLRALLPKLDRLRPGLTGEELDYISTEVLSEETAQHIHLVSGIIRKCDLESLDLDDQKVTADAALLSAGFFRSSRFFSRFSPGLSGFVNNVSAAKFLYKEIFEVRPSNEIFLALHHNASIWAFGLWLLAADFQMRRPSEIQIIKGDP